MNMNRYYYETEDDAELPYEDQLRLTAVTNPLLLTGEIVVLTDAGSVSQPKGGSRAKRTAVPT